MLVNPQITWKKVKESEKHDRLYIMMITTGIPRENCTIRWKGQNREIVQP